MAKIIEFYEYWNSISNYYFNQNDEIDKYLINNYGSLIDDYNEGTSIIYDCLIYDQLTRHYYRKEVSSHIITYFNNKTYNLISKYKYDKEIINNLGINDWIFYMLVLRHTNRREELLYVMNECWERLLIIKDPIPVLLKKFIRATYTRGNFNEEVELVKFEKDNDNYNNYLEILDSISPTYINFNINNNNKIGNYSELYKYSTIIISLSGGVDSVSCLFSLRKIGKKIIAVHINYNNRKETEEEVKFLSTICHYLDVKLYVRKIEEIKREKANKYDLRDIYENYTKKVRYNSYKRVFEIENDDKNQTKPLVVLGHNKDDCLENILTNMAYNNKYENLRGIELETEIDNIIFYRGLIEITKDEIYKFAINNNLPFLKNSTPEWCQRGKIRTSVVPILKKWDNRIIDGLFNMSLVMEELYKNMMRNVKEFEIRSTIKEENLNSESYIYWKNVIFNLFKFYPSNKSLRTLIERLENWKNKKKEINKKTKIIINNRLILLLWKNKEPGMISYEFIIS
jgi:tRNA(Ile)-lysidine synthetase-like protein